jgi:hypothetical protein
MLARTLLVMTLVVASGASFSRLFAQPNLGRVKSQSVTQVAVDDQGHPVVGGKLNLIVDDQKPEACVIRVQRKQGELLTYPYLVYLVREGSKPELLLRETLVKDDPEFGYHWRQQDEIKAVGLDGGTIRITSSYSPSRGPFSDYLLSSDADKRLILRAQTTAGTGGYVGVIRNYDNLDDGK